jgi:hypothetical protein
MPNKLKSGKQFRFMQAAAHGTLKGVGPSPQVAKEMLSKEGHKKRSKLAKMK